MEQLAGFLGVACDKAQLEGLVESCNQLIEQCSTSEALTVCRGERDGGGREGGRERERVFFIFFSFPRYILLFSLFSFNGRTAREARVPQGSLSHSHTAVDATSCPPKLLADIYNFGPNGVAVMKALF